MTFRHGGKVRRPGRRLQIIIVQPYRGDQLVMRFVRPEATRGPHAIGGLRNARDSPCDRKIRNPISDIGQRATNNGSRSARRGERTAAVARGAYATRFGAVLDSSARRAQRLGVFFFFLIHEHVKSDSCENRSRPVTVSVFGLPRSSEKTRSFRLKRCCYNVLLLYYYYSRMTCIGLDFLTRVCDMCAMWRCAMCDVRCDDGLKTSNKIND